MHRTQLYLDHDLYRALAAAAARHRKTISEVVREHLRRSVGEKLLMDPVEALDQACGAWSGRTDLPDTARWVRGLRKSTRMVRHGRTPARRTPDRPR